jgi:hypothetical protein
MQMTSTSKAIKGVIIKLYNQMLMDWIFTCIIFSKNDNLRDDLKKKPLIMKNSGM